MPHPIYGPPEHKLQRVEFNLRVPTKENSFVARLTAQGYAETKRSTLWSFSDSYMYDAKGDEHAPLDQLRLLALVALQDRPASLAALELGLRGGVPVPDSDPLF